MSTAIACTPVTDDTAMHLHLDSHPDDLTTRLVLADWYEENGREREAACQRWMVDNGRWSEQSPGRDYPVNGLNVFWYWWRITMNHDDTSVLPERVIDHVLGTADGRVFDTRQDAEAALLAALVKAGEIV